MTKYPECWLMPVRRLKVPAAVAASFLSASRDFLRPQGKRRDAASTRKRRVASTREFHRGKMPLSFFPLGLGSRAPLPPPPTPARRHPCPPHRLTPHASHLPPPASRADPTRTPYPHPCPWGQSGARPDDETLLTVAIR
jgi:hypothetical protein